MGVNNRVRSLKAMLCFKRDINRKYTTDALTEQQKKPNFSIEVEKFGAWY